MTDSMNFANNAQKLIFENIFLNSPSTEDILNSSKDFARLFGEELTDAQVSLEIWRLEAGGQIFEITPEKAISLKEMIGKVYAPVELFPDYAHYSVSEKAGKAWQIFSGNTDSRIEVEVASHIHFLTPSESISRQIAQTFEMENPSVTLLDAYFAPEYECERSYLCEIVLMEEKLFEVIRLRNEFEQQFKEALSSNLDSLTQSSKPILSVSEWQNLFASSGVLGRDRFRRTKQEDVNRLLDLGLMEIISDRDTARVLREKQNDSNGCVYGVAFQQTDKILTPDGAEIVRSAIKSCSDIRDSIVFTIEPSSLIRSYHCDIDDARKAIEKLKTSGYSPFALAKISGWCKQWWNVHSEGATFTYWKNAD